MIDITHWTIVLLGARTLIGREGVDDEGLTILEPVYDVGVQPVQAPGGRMAFRRIVLPVLMWDISRIHLPDSYAKCPVKDLPVAHRDELAHAVEEAAEMRHKLRAAASGLVIANTLPADRGDPVPAK